MKIAAITDDGKTISAHFGRAHHYLVFAIEEVKIVAQEQRDKVGHDDFAGQDQAHEHHGRNDPRGHGFGGGSAQRHARMIASIEDCDVILARGMGQGIYLALKEAGITPITTDIRSVEDAVQAYLRGEIIDRPERRH